jgi:Tfp pilus assembly protein PilF
MVNLGVFRYNSGLKDNAVEYFKGALEAEPSHKTARANLKALGFEVHDHIISDYILEGE